MGRRQLTAGFAMAAAAALPSPVLLGTWPDPSFTRADGEHVAVVTANRWAPIMRVLRSPDLDRWRITGAVFREPPGWAETNFWAPEITRFGNGYALFYSALPKRRGSWYCVGVAFAPEPEGPWRDHGRPLRCGKRGSIDPFPVRDERGRLHLLWKQDGNAFDRPTPIFAQRLREDGRALVGRKVELIRNDSDWEANTVEAPLVIRRRGFFHLIYSGNLCCTRSCAYGIGVARSRRLLGPWRKFAGNPIMRGGNGWRCPGHTGLARGRGGRLTALFHAYRATEETFGRQLLAAPIRFRPDGWPRIGNGLPPTSSAGATTLSFTDDFDGPLAPEWEWPLARVPGIRTDDGDLELRPPAKERGEGEVRLDAGVLARRMGVSRYTATARIDRTALEGDEQAGLALYRAAHEAIGLSTSRGRVVAWQRHEGRFRRLASEPVPSAAMGEERPSVHLRMVSIERKLYFEASADGLLWTPLGEGFSGPVEDEARYALTVGGHGDAAVRFISAKLEENR